MSNIDVVEISTIIAIIGCFVGLAGWLSGRDKRIISDAQWKGSVDAKLDMLIGIKTDVERIADTIGHHSERLMVAEEKIERVQRNIDDLKRGVCKHD